MDDVTYYHSIKYDYQDDYIASGDDFDSIYTFYQDSYGNIIGAELYSGSASSGNYLYLSDSYASYYSALYGEAYVAAAVTFVDGTEDVIYLRVTNSTSATSAYFYNPDLESTYYIRSGAASGTSSPVYDDNNKIIAYEGYGDVIDAGWYSYTVNSSGYYTLSELDTDVVGTATGVTTDDDTTAVKFDTDNNSSVDKTLYANSSTELVLVDSGLVYTGYTNFPSADYGTLDDPSDTDVSVLYVTNSGGRLTDIYVLGTGSTTVDVTFAVYRSSVGTTADGYQYSFYVDGSYSTYLFASADSLTRYTSVGFLLEDSDGYYSFVAASEDSADDYGYGFTTGIVLDADDDFVEVWVDSNNDDTQDSDEVYYFALADDYEATRINSSESLTGSRAQEGDTVYVFSTKVSSGTAEAYAVFALDEDLVSDTDEDDGTTTDSNTVYGVYQRSTASGYIFYVDGAYETYYAAASASLTLDEGIVEGDICELTLDDDGYLTAVEELTYNNPSTDGTYYGTSDLVITAVYGTTVIGKVGDGTGAEKTLFVDSAVIYDLTGEGASTLDEGDSVSVLRSAYDDDNNGSEATAYVIYIKEHNYEIQVDA